MQIKTVQISRFAMPCLTFGEGVRPLVVLAGLSPHSVLNDGEELRALYAELLPTHRLYFFEPPCVLPENYSLRDYACDVGEAMDALGLRRADVCGVSMGGMVAQILAALRPELVRSLAVVSSAAANGPVSRTVFSRWLTLAELGAAREMKRDFLAEIYSADYLAENAEACEAFAGAPMTTEELRRMRILLRALLDFDGRDLLAAISCPALVLAGERDGIFSAVAAKELARLLRAGLCILPGGSHAVYDEARDLRTRLFRFFTEETEAAERLSLAPIFSDGAVLQRDREIRVFGTGYGTVTARFLGEERTAQAEGRFCLTFSAHPAGGPYEMEVMLGGERRILRELYIGEVLMLAGQSNAELTIAATSDRDVAFPGDPRVRFFLASRPMEDEQLRTLEMAHSPMDNHWNILTEEEAPKWSALALHLGRYYAEKLGIHVGLIGCYKGATVIRSFMSEAACARFPMEERRLQGDYRVPWNHNAELYHLMLEKLMPYNVRAFIWYQGESDRTIYEAQFYEEMLVTFIAEWREEMRLVDAPVAVVQINDFPEICQPGVRAIQLAQARACRRIPLCELVPIADLGEHEKIHPENKRAVAERVAAALDRMGL